MSAFDRNPRKADYERRAKGFGGYDQLGRRINRSPQNRHVRFAVDRSLAMKPIEPDPLTRQVVRKLKRGAL